MKKLYTYIFSAFAAVTLVTSCNDYEAPVFTTEEAITIVSRETDFPAGPSTGFVKFEADGTVTVTSNNAWIDAQVVGDEIQISCTQNISLYNRTGSITARCGQKATTISIIQEGVLLKFISEDIKFEAAPSTQTFTLNANTPLEITSDSEWVTVSTTPDNVMTVTVQENPSLDSRSATLTATVGDNTASAKVIQDGIYVGLFDLEDWFTQSTEATTVTYEFPYSLPVSFSDVAEWITCNFEDGVITITTDQNNTGDIREGSFTYTVGTKTSTVNVLQCSFETDLVGSNWRLYYYSAGTGGTLSYRAVSLKYDDGNYYMVMNINSSTVGQVTLNVPLDWVPETGYAALRGMKFCGPYGANYCYTNFTYLNDGGYYFAYNADPMEYMEGHLKSENGVIKLQFEDSGLYTYPVHGFTLRYYNSQTEFTSTTYVGNVTTMYYPYLQRTN